MNDPTKGVIITHQELVELICAAGERGLIIQIKRHEESSVMQAVARVITTAWQSQRVVCRIEGDPCNTDYCFDPDNFPGWEFRVLDPAH